MLIPSNKHKVIKIIKSITNVEVPTLNDLELVKNLFIEKINSGYSSEEINVYYNLGYPKNNFASVLRNCFGITLKSRKQSVINFCSKNGTLITDEKKQYYKKCSFSFKTFDPRTPGIELLEEYKFLQGQHQSNTDHLNRDHMISKKYGWENNIDYNIISHPANCQIILAKENQIKSSKCCITYVELITRIKNW